MLTFFNIVWLYNHPVRFYFYTFVSVVTYIHFKYIYTSNYCHILLPEKKEYFPSIEQEPTSLGVRNFLLKATKELKNKYLSIR